MKKRFLHAFVCVAIIGCAFEINAQTGVTKFGTNALAVNGASGDYNTAFGYFVLAANTSGNRNTGTGANTLRFNTIGIYNTATGAAALYQNTNGSYNSAFGAYSLFTNTSGYRNTAFGNESMRLNTTGYLNTGFGDRALYSTTSGNFNTALGATALYTNTTGYENTASGNECMYNNTTGSSNTAAGCRSMYLNTTGGYNTTSGYYSLFNNKTGAANTAIGANALRQNSTGGYNTALGYEALNSNTTGMRNTVIGGLADVSSNNLSNATAIGYGAIATGSNRVRIGNSLVTSIGGQVGWTVFSDGRFKEDIKEDVPGLAFINSLRPVSYTVNVKGLNEYYNKVAGKHDPAKTAMEQSDYATAKIVHNGFVAQEVEAAAKKLTFDFSGVDKPETKDGLYGLRYDNFISPIVKAVQELSAKNDEKDSVINDLQSLVTDLQNQINDLKSLVTKSGDGGSIIASSAYLKQNAPNPFSNNTVISYYIPDHAGRAQLRITDVNGRVIKTFNAAKGEGKINIRSGELAAGNYNYTLYINNKAVDTKQMVLSK